MAGRLPLRPRLPLQLLLPVLGLGAGVACSGDGLTHTPPLDPAALYWELALNHHAVTLSLQPPYDTLTLQATPRNALGEPLEGVGTVQYSSPDLDRVQVKPGGVLQAVGLTVPGQPIAVVATLTTDNLQHVDTVLVKVVADTLPKLARLSILADRAKIPIGIIYAAFLPIPIQGVDHNDSTVSDLLVAVRSSDSLTVKIGSLFGRPTAEGLRLGEVTLVASATVFGAARADTVSYRVGWPLFERIWMRQVPAANGDKADPPTVRVGVGALVMWTNESDTPTDVTFTDEDTPNIAAADSSTPAFVELSKGYQLPVSFIRNVVFCGAGVVGEGNLANCDGRGSFVLSPETYQRAMRVFPKPGTYEYHSTSLGAMGRVIVMDER